MPGLSVHRTRAQNRKRAAKTPKLSHRPGLQRFGVLTKSCGLEKSEITHVRLKPKRFNSHCARPVAAWSARFIVVPSGMWRHGRSSKAPRLMDVSVFIYSLSLFLALFFLFLSFSLPLTLTLTLSIPQTDCLPLTSSSNHLRRIASWSQNFSAELCRCN